MRSVICWIFGWMLVEGLVIAVNSSGEWAKELETVSQSPFIFVGAFIALYAVTVIPAVAIISKDTTKTMEAKYGGEIKALKATLEGETKQNKRLEAKITELEKQLLNRSSPPHQFLPEPVSVVEISETNKETLKLPPAESDQSDLSQPELKIQASSIANKIYRAIGDAKSQGIRIPDGLEIVTEFLYGQRNDVRDKKYKNIVDAILRYYSNELHDIAFTVKLKILVPDGMELLSRADYINPKGLRQLEAIAKDLKDIANT